MDLPEVPFFAQKCESTIMHDTPSRNIEETDRVLYRYHFEPQGEYELTHTDQGVFVEQFYDTKDHDLLGRGCWLRLRIFGNGKSEWTLKEQVYNPAPSVEPLIFFF